MILDFNFTTFAAANVPPATSRIDTFTFFSGDGDSVDLASVIVDINSGSTTKKATTAGVLLDPNVDGLVVICDGEGFRTEGGGDVDVEAGGASVLVGEVADG